MNIDDVRFVNDKEKLDQKLQEIIAEGELNELGVKCGLNHNCPEDEIPMAVDYLCQNFGDVTTGVIDTTLQIPICAECLISLFSKFQILLLCVNCASSQWIYRPESKIEWPENQTLFLLKQCPKCYDPSGI
jgi:hypothetical protein